ncbi:MAG: hypothetical protein CMI54_02820 [Parcubacteria group bacterium]|nr:hypothetical protein [Parcubacteria group bacterium]
MALNLTRKRYKKLKSFVYLLDRGICHICSRELSYKKAVLDHIIPQSISGNGECLSSDDYWNLRLAHKSCNTIRGNAKKPGQLRLNLPQQIYQQESK